MGRSSEAAYDDEQLLLIPPGWPQYLMVVVGFALLVGPTLAVVWPR